MNVNGIIALHKPAGLTSHDCVNRVRRLAKTRKVGHTGTLDPLVTGVLPICLNQATKVAEYLLDFDKEYVAQIQLGRSTTTQDQQGEVLVDEPLKIAPTKRKLEEILASFSGQLEQIPPMYSAIKIKGKKLYELAREGKEVEREARLVQIEQIELLTYEEVLPYPVLTIRVRCSKGTYIRSLAVDIGQALGYPAHLSGLIRVKSGPFTLDQSVSLEELESWNAEDWQTKVFPMDSALSLLPKLSLNQEMSQRVLFGQSLFIQEKIVKDQLYRIYNPNDQLIAIYVGKNERIIRPKKVFQQ